MKKRIWLSRKLYEWWKPKTEGWIHYKLGEDGESRGTFVKGCYSLKEIVTGLRASGVTPTIEIELNKNIHLVIELYWDKPIEAYLEER
jgi:hypothetical protein